MDREGWSRLRGLKRLLHDGVGLGSTFVEKHHRHAVELPFDVLEAIEPIAAPTKVVRGVHAGMLSFTYGSIRAVNHTVEVAGDWVVDRIATADEASEG